MIRINLLPFREPVRKTTTRQWVYFYLVGLLAAAGVMGFLWISRDGRIQDLQRREARLKEEVGRFAKYEVMLKELKAQKEIIEQKKEVIRSLQRDRDHLVRSLTLFSLMTPPERMWFQRFTQSGEQVSISGVAVSNEAIAEFMRNLETSPFVGRGSVSLAHSRMTSMGGSKLREFQLSCKVLPYSAVQKTLSALPQGSAAEPEHGEGKPGPGSSPAGG